MYKRRGLAFILCAPSGGGKTTLSKKLLTEFSNVRYSVSCTTRPPRAGEVDGIDYKFISRANFLALCEENAFLEWAEVHGNLYGTPRLQVEQTLSAGGDLLFDIDVQGAAQIRLNMPGIISLAFVVPPSLAELKRRLVARGTDSEEVIAKRLAAAHNEIENAHWYNYIIVNDNLETAYAQLRAAYMASTLTPYHQSNLLNALAKEAV